MTITIDYNGSKAECILYGCIPTTKYPFVSPYKHYNFNDADPYSQAYALSAFECIKKQFERQKKQ